MRIGIDLGTSNSCAAVYRDGAAQMIEMPDGSNSLPSVVAHKMTGSEINTLIGRPAERQERENAKYTYRHFKRALAVPFSEDEHSGWQHVKGPDGMLWFGGVDGESVSPQELSAEVIYYILDAAESFLGERPTGAVITVPAEFKKPHKDAILDAAARVGLTSISIMTEPEAAAMAFGAGAEKFETVAVFDFGGGTFDICLAQVLKGSFEVLRTGGRLDLGGVNFDNELLKHCVRKFADEHGDDLNAKPHCIPHVREASEKAKIDLSTLDESCVYVDNLTTTETGFRSLKQDITREEFEALVNHLVDQTIQITKETMAQAGLHPKEIDRVILVGGMTRVPAVRKAVTDYFGKAPMTGVKPEEAVAKGAAIRAAMLDGRVSMKSFLQRLDASTGIRRAGGVLFCPPELSRGVELPVSAELLLKPAEEDQEVCTIEIYQGDQMNADDNVFLFQRSLPVPEDGTVRLNIAFDEEGVMTAKANDELIYGG